MKAKAKMKAKANHETMVKYDNANGEKVKTNLPSGKFAGTYTHYKIQPDGSLRRMGEVAYRHDVEPAADFDTLFRGKLDPAQASGSDTMTFHGEVCDIAEAFETLVDLTCEAEG